MSSLPIQMGCKLMEQGLLMQLMSIWFQGLPKFMMVNHQLIMWVQAPLLPLANSMLGIPITPP